MVAEQLLRIAAPGTLHDAVMVTTLHEDFPASRFGIIPNFVMNKLDTADGTQRLFDLP